jgi:hypothetical protein
MQLQVVKETGYRPKNTSISRSNIMLIFFRNGVSPASASIDAHGRFIKD